MRERSWRGREGGREQTHGEKRKGKPERRAQLGNDTRGWQGIGKYRVMGEM